MSFIRSDGSSIPRMETKRETRRETRPETRPETRRQATRQTKHLRTRHIPKTPEIGSLYDILHDHSGTSLFVLPICWTDIHTRLLGCQFVQLPAQTIPVPPAASSPRKSPQQPTPSIIVNIGRDLDTLMNGRKPVGRKNQALQGILSTLFPNQLTRTKPCPELGIRFGSRFYRRAARCHIIWKHPDTTAQSFDSATTWTSSRSTSQLLASMTVNVSNDAPMLAYVGRRHLHDIRRTCFRVVSAPNDSYNGPVHRLQIRRSKKLIPDDPNEDPYLIAIMIGMAQQAVYGDIERGTGFEPRDVQVRVMTISDEEDSRAHAFVVYTATVPAAFLRMFHEPDKAPRGDARIRITHVAVPVWPVLGLKERLGHVLGKDVVGVEFDGAKMDTFEDGKQLSSLSRESTPSPKRRREALSEVFNASFSEDRDGDCQAGNGVLGGMKRRCLEEGMVEEKDEEAKEKKHHPVQVYSPQKDSWFQEDGVEEEDGGSDDAELDG
ncbi:hypothetical protein F5B20DRAFT_221069 [Whalleya microplaca]|nr:hypothetical protein F5B20DRAFT_221069 [Whalleya microplaca]